MNRSLDSLKALVAGTTGDASHRSPPGVVVFGAGKGGVGTSVAAGLVALAAARRGASVLLVDADETVGSLHLMLGFPGGVPGLGALRRGAVEPMELVLDVEPGLSLFPGGGGGVDATLAVASAERRMMLRRVAGLYERYDMVVVDGGSRLDSVMAACAAGTRRLVALTTPDRISQAAAYALLKVTRGRFRELPVDLLVNHASEEAARDVLRMVQTASTSFLGTDVSFAGAFPEDSELQLHLARGASLGHLPSGAPTAAAACRMADWLLAEAEAELLPRAATLPLRADSLVP